MFFKLILLLFGLTMLTTPQTPDSPLPAPGVSRELARARAAIISHVRYKLDLALLPGAARLKGRAEIRFALKQAEANVIVDFRDLDAAGQISAGAAGDFRVNGQPVNDLARASGHLIFPARYFQSGENIIELAFETSAAPAGRPLIRYQDRDDGNEYLYTLFVPMDASLAFPCFDQPDLKARFTFTASAPSEWKIVSNTREASVTREGATARWQFAETEPISTYLFAFAAGPFQELRGDAAPTPTRLLVRASQFKRAQEEWPEVARITREGMKHLVGYFDRRFPFSKYDQVLLPGFAYGGMEHAGATFLREDSILFRTTPTRGDHLSRASLVLHELTHQWFGDLVTMRWFDDLWLKEGFANFMAYEAMAALYDRNEVRKRFYLAHKPLAYGIDATRGTTPIYQEIANLKDAKSAYGAIVYQKAPSLLSALQFMLGAEKFRDGVRLFLRQHDYANAEWSDLIGAFEAASKQRLGGWANAWVRRRGMPQVEVDWSCDAAGKIARLELRQHDVQGEGRVWPIRTQLLLAYDDAPHERLTINLEGARITVPQAVGRRCPAYVFANDGDHAYGRFSLEARSRAAVMERIDKVRDPLARALLWGALWDGVRAAELDPRDFIQLAIKTLPTEADEELTQSLLDRTGRAFQRYLSPTRKAELAPQLEALLFDRMMKASALGLRVTYFRAFRAVATTPAARGQLKDLLAGKLIAPGVEIKPLDRWRIITALLAAEDSDAKALLTAEQQRDQTDEGRKQAYIALAARADAATKQKYFDDYTRNRTVPEDWIEGSLAPFNALNQSALTLPFLRPALDALPQVKRERKIFFVLAWLNAFIGGQGSQAALDEVNHFLRAAPLDRDLELKVLEVMDELERTVRIRARFDGK